MMILPLNASLIQPEPPVASARTLPAPPLLTVVIPTFNERSNVAALIARLDAVLADIAWEVVFVDDDSPDATHALVKSIARRNGRVRCLRRVGRRGLAGACIEGILSSAAPYVAVMDGDLQHDETILPRMLERLRSDECDLVVGSRLVAGGSADAGFNWARAMISDLSGRLTRLVLRADVKDVMSGFFMLRRDIAEATAPHLCPEGFKILADLLASSRTPMRVAEIGYTFRARQSGESKLDAKVALDFLGLLANKLTRGLIPLKFISFGLVGAAGIGVHMAVLTVLMGMAFSFGAAQMAATLCAIAFNFFLNNAATYRDSALRGWRLLTGLGLFYVVCSVGAIANVALASFLFEKSLPWWSAALAGIVMGAVWNYALSSLFVWRRRT